MTANVESCTNCYWYYCKSNKCAECYRQNKYEWVGGADGIIEAIYNNVYGEGKPINKGEDDD